MGHDRSKRYLISNVLPIENFVSKKNRIHSRPFLINVFRKIRIFRWILTNFISRIIVTVKTARAISNGEWEHLSRKRSTGNDQKKKKKKKEIDHRPWSTPVNECVRERNRGGGRGRRRRRRRHSGLLLQALVRGGGRLGRLEGVPFQTLRIDLFVDGSSSLHPLLVVVDHVLKLFQRFSTGSLLSFFFFSPLLCPGTRLPLVEIVRFYRNTSPTIAYRGNGILHF